VGENIFEKKNGGLSQILMVTKYFFNNTINYTVNIQINLLWFKK